MLKPRSQTLGLVNADFEGGVPSLGSAGRQLHTGMHLEDVRQEPQWTSPVIPPIDVGWPSGDADVLGEVPLEVDEEASHTPFALQT